MTLCPYRGSGCRRCYHWLRLMEPLLAQARAWLSAFAADGEFACGTRLLDEAAPTSAGRGGTPTCG
jgi:hypothetical protein